MVNLSTRPEGSSIKVQENAQGATLSWKAARDKDRPGLGLTAFICFWLFGWAVGEVMVALKLINTIRKFPFLTSTSARPYLGLLFQFAWLGGWTIAGIAIIRILWPWINVGKPESITLGHDTFNYQPGGSATSAAWRGKKSKKGKLKPGQSISLPRRELPPLDLSWAGGRQRLSFDFGADRIEIGRYLREPDREWLAEVIGNWQQ